MIIKDIGDALKAALSKDVAMPIYVRETSFTYPIKDAIWDNWFPFAYVAFQKLNCAMRVQSFAAIGTGSGADAIGACYTFDQLKTIVITDIDERVVPVAQENVKRYAATVDVVALAGALCAPLRENSTKVDLIYENLPNIPNAEDIIHGFRQSSFYGPGSFRVQNQEAKSYLLESHLATLIEARESLSKQGKVICSIGGRVPHQILHRIVETAGYTFNELVTGFKVQTEPEEVLPGYSAAEKNGVIFDFYKYDDASRFLDSHGIKKPYLLNAERLKKLLFPFRITAHEALKLYRSDQNHRIGHVIHMIEATKKE